MDSWKLATLKPLAQLMDSLLARYFFWVFPNHTDKTFVIH